MPHTPAPRIIITARDDLSRTVWFFNHRVTFQLMRAESPAGLCIMYAQMSRGDTAPLHVHHDEDEMFHMLAGEARFRIGDTTHVVRPGQTLVTPRNVPHCFVVDSERAEMLIMTTGGFEDVVRRCGRPAAHDGLPDHAEPSPEAVALLAAVCAENHIDLLGPPAI